MLWSGSGASGDNFNSGIYYSLVHVCTMPLKKAPGHRILLREHSYDNWHWGINEEWQQIYRLAGHDQFYCTT